MYVVSLKQFDGPLDLLLSLVQHAKIDIQDIFVSQITEQYLESMAGVDELDMDSASEFLAMAATLMEIKSRALLPAPPEPEEEGEETPEQALIRQLTEYKAFKELSQDMRKLEDEARSLISKLPEEYPLPPPPVEQRRPSRPVLSFMSMSASAMVSMASSQLMRSHWLPPRSPTRFMGYLLRLG